MSDVTSEASTRASADTNLQNQVNSLNSSVSNGKTQVANAITGKGVAASGSDSFATLASKISSISTMNATEQTVYSGVRTFAAPTGMNNYSDGLTLISGPDKIYYGGTTYATFQGSYGYVHQNRFTKVVWEYRGAVPVSIALDPAFNLKSETFTFSVNEQNSTLPPVYQIVSVSRQNNHMQISLNIGLAGTAYYWDSAKTDQTTKLVTVQTLGTIYVEFSLDTSLTISF